MVVASYHSLVQPIHIVGLKRRLQCDHLIEDAPKRPNIASSIVWLIVPNFGACIVRSPCLSLHHTSLGNLTDIKVS